MNFLLSSTLLALSALALAGCASVPAPATSSPTSPANAAAAEGPVQKLELFAPIPASVAATIESAPAGATTRGADPSKMDAPNQDASTDTYTCVMHPQIAEPRPGKCPICEMALVEKAKAKP